MHKWLHVKSPHIQRSTILVSRRNAKNGRQDTNEDELHAALHNSSVDVSIFTGGTLASIQATFATASVVIGSHGGGLYNIIFAPLDTCVIENQSYEVFIGSGGGTAGNEEMFYVISGGLGQPYWRIVADAGGFVFNVPGIVAAVLQCSQGL